MHIHNSIESMTRISIWQKQKKVHLHMYTIHRNQTERDDANRTARYNPFTFLRTLRYPATVSQTLQFPVTLFDQPEFTMIQPRTTLRHLNYPALVRSLSLVNLIFVSVGEVICYREGRVTQIDSESLQDGCCKQPDATIYQRSTTHDLRERRARRDPRGRRLLRQVSHVTWPRLCLVMLVVGKH